MTLSRFYSPACFGLSSGALADSLPVLCCERKKLVVPHNLFCGRNIGQQHLKHKIEHRWRFTGNRRIE